MAGMKIDAKLTDAALLPLIGARLAGVRVAAKLTQEQLAGTRFAEHETGE